MERNSQFFTDLPGSTSRLTGQLKSIVWRIQRTVSQPGPPDTGGTPLVQEFLPSSPSKKVRTSFKTSDITGLLSTFEGSPFFLTSTSLMTSVEVMKELFLILRLYLACHKQNPGGLILHEVFSESH